MSIDEESEFDEGAFLKSQPEKPSWLYWVLLTVIAVVVSIIVFVIGPTDHDD